MPKRVLDVGQCPPDHAAIRILLEANFDVEIVRAHLPSDTLAQLRSGKFDLVLINRKLDEDYSDGLEILKEIKADPRIAATPVMLVTNYPEHQAAAVAAGAEYGFGKLELRSPETLERLRKVLGEE
jgi:two-component system chemotaxis response regulator CheY